MHQLLKAQIENRSPELLITVGSPAQLRVDGEMVPLKMEPLTPADVKTFTYAVLNDAQRAAFERDGRLRMAFGVKGLSRFRMTLYQQRGAIAATLKAIPYALPAADPALAPLLSWSQATAGLHVLSGRPDSGRTTALAGLVDKANVDRHAHLVTLEEPIELLHPHKNSVVDQLEAGADFKAPADGVQRAVGARADLVAWDMEKNHLPELLELAQSGVAVLATFTAADPDQVSDEAAKHGEKARKALVHHAHLTLSPAAKKTPRKLSVKVVS